MEGNVLFPLLYWRGTERLLTQTAASSSIITLCSGQRLGLVLTTKSQRFGGTREVSVPLLWVETHDSDGMVGNRP